MVTFSRGDFDRCAAVRIDKAGTVTKTANLKRRQMRKLGYSYTVLYSRRLEGKEGGEGEEGEEGEGGGRVGRVGEEVVVSRQNIGKRAARERVSILNQKLRSKSRSVRMEEGKMFHVPSLVRICLGFMVFALIALVGEFDSEEYREKVEKRND